MRTYSYYPLPIGADQAWTTAAQVYLHLLSNESERDRIYYDVCTIRPGEPFSVYVNHTNTPQRLTISTVDSDITFVRHIEACLWYADQDVYYKYKQQQYVLHSPPSYLPIIQLSTTR